MPSKIDEPSRDLPPLGGSDQSEPLEPRPAPPESVKPVVCPADGVRRLQRLETASGRLPVADPVRIEAIRSPLQNGTYEIDARRIADRLCELEQQLALLE